MAASILADIKNRNGWDTYQIYFRMYSAWFAARYEAQPPTCELTGLVILNLNLATDFMRWMGSPGAAKTVGQVNPPCSPDRCTHCPSASASYPHDIHVPSPLFRSVVITCDPVIP